MQPNDTRPLVAKTRGDLIEMIHRGAYVIVSSEGEILHAVGNPETWTYLRSCAKPFQALPIVERGAVETFELTPEELAVCTASHSGEPIHLETIRSALAKAGLDEGLLQCGPHLPLETGTAHEMIRRREAPTAIHSNCSGKHAGMLLSAHVAGQPLDTYLEYDHPLQIEIREGIAALAGLAPEEIVVSRDGCGAPVHGLPLWRIAWMYARLAKPDGLAAERAEALRTIRDAMMAAPYLVSGKGRIEVALMSTFAGRLVSKSGALGVYGIGLPELGIGIALKVEDGDATTRSATAIRALRHIAEDELGKTALDRLWEELCPPIRNYRREVVGEVLWIGDGTRSNPPHRTSSLPRRSRDDSTNPR